MRRMGFAAATRLSLVSTAGSQRSPAVPPLPLRVDGETSFWLTATMGLYKLVMADG